MIPGPPDPDPPIPPGRSIVGIRSARLGRGLRAFGVGQGSRVVVLCCDRHSEDRAVALGALAALGAVAVEPPDLASATLAPLAAGAPVVQLACHEGVEAWRAVGGHGITIGDAEDVVWWKALECRHSAA